MSGSTPKVQWVWMAWGVVGTVAALSLGADSCNGVGTTGTNTCLACHDGRSAPDKREWRQSAHRRFACESCHGDGLAHVRNGGRDGLFIDNPERWAFDDANQFCGDCHPEALALYEETAHAVPGAARCTDCHDVHKRSGLVVDKALPALYDNDTAAALCGRCHRRQVEDFLDSGHAVLGVAWCGSCHNAHLPRALMLDFEDNDICQQCHASVLLGLHTPAAVDFHTGPFHPVDPAGSGSSRCTGCHMPPVSQFHQPGGPHDHTLFTVPPVFSNVIDTVAPPNSCAGIAGCHDPNVPGSGLPHDVNDPAGNVALQELYESIGGIP